MGKRKTHSQVIALKVVDIPELEGVAEVEDAHDPTFGKNGHVDFGTKSIRVAEPNGYKRRKADAAVARRLPFKRVSQSGVGYAPFQERMPTPPFRARKSPTSISELLLGRDTVYHIVAAAFHFFALSGYTVVPAM